MRTYIARSGDRMSLTDAEVNALIAYYRVGIDGLQHVKGKTIKSLMNKGCFTAQDITPEGRALAKELSDEEHYSVVGGDKRGNPGMVKATVWSYDVWGNANDGYEVNDRSKFGTFDVYKDALMKDDGVLRFLKDIGFLKKTTRLSSLDFDGDDMTIYVNASRDGYPLCGIEIGD